LRSDLSGHGPQQILQAVNDAWVIVANLKQHFRISWDYARRTGIKGDAAGGPYGARAAQRGEPIVDGHAKPGQRHADILTNAHAGRASVILLAGKADLVLPDPDDGGDDADCETFAFERLALLDMRLEISDMSPELGGHARPAG
jgi:hypothetical protein